MSEPSVQTGSVFGDDFRILEPLGSGGMGEVFLAEQISTGKQRAVKVMHARLTDDAKQRERFTREARVAAAVESDHVVEIIGAGVHEKSGVPWIAMELLAGEDLAAYLKRIGPLTVGAASGILEELCHALGAAHDAGIVHRDLKPHNVFMCESRTADAKRRVKVLDFGIAKLIADSTMSTTAALGSPAWMSPEQTEASPRISPASDVWSLGLLTFWMLTGRSFWRAANSREGSVQGVLREMVIEDIPPGSHRADEIGCRLLWPSVLDPWLNRCLQREPEHRFTNASEAHEGFCAVLNGEELPPLAEPVEDDDEPSTRRGAPVSAPTRELEPVPQDAEAERASGVDTTQRSAARAAEIDITASPITRAESAGGGGLERLRLVLVAAAVLSVFLVAVLFYGREEAVRTSAVERAVDSERPRPHPTAEQPDPEPGPTAAPTAEPTDDHESAERDRDDDEAAPRPAPRVVKRPANAAPSEGGPPPFDDAKAQQKIASARSQASSACKALEGPRQFSATLVYHRSGTLTVKGSFSGDTGVCVKAALGMARVGPFGPDNARSRQFSVSVSLP